MEYICHKPEGMGEDRKNCALRATSLVLNKPYHEVAKMYAKHGRVYRKGCSIRIINNALGELIDGSTPKLPTVLKLSFGKFVKLFPKGRFIVIKSGHAIALIDGKWYDDHEPSPRAFVKCFYRI